ncbi:MAG: glycosyltransferase family 39 protein [Myxococcota bacterium]
MGGSKRRRPATRVAERLALAAVVLAMLFSAAVRIRLADTPFERDEGEYAYAGQLVLQGVPPYELAYNMKFPGAYYAYAAAFAVFGETPSGAHLGLLVVNAATTLFVLLLGRRLLGEFAGALAACAFVLLSLDRFVMGIFAHATHFVTLPVTAALWVLLRSGLPASWRSSLGAGVLLGIAVLMKQHALVYLPFAAALVAWQAPLRTADGRRAAASGIAWLAAGAAIPFAALLALFAFQGVLGAFWFWTFGYASEYVSEIAFSGAPSRFLRTLEKISRADRALWIAAALGLGALWLRGTSREARVVIGGLLCASLLAVVPGYYFREHYFIVVLPAAALLVGVAAAAAERALAARAPAHASRIAVAVAGLALASSCLIAQRDFLFRWSPRELSRTHYGTNPFVESAEVARYIRERTGVDDRIAVLGSEPQIYFHAGRRSATGYIYMYPLLENHALTATMQDEMIRQVIEAHPAYLVFVSIRSSWQSLPNMDQRVLKWSQRYASACYDLVGIADIHSPTETTFVWDEAVKDYEPKSQSLVYTLRRKSDAPCSAS